MQAGRARDQIRHVQCDGREAQYISADPQRPMMGRSQRNMQQHRRKQTQYRETGRDNDIGPHAALPPHAQSHKKSDVPQERQSRRQRGKPGPLLAVVPPVQEEEIQHHPEQDGARAVPGGVHQQGFVDTEPIRHSGLTISNFGGQEWLSCVPVPTAGGRKVIHLGVPTRSLFASPKKGCAFIYMKTRPLFAKDRRNVTMAYNLLHLPRQGEAECFIKWVLRSFYWLRWFWRRT